MRIFKHCNDYDQNLAESYRKYLALSDNAAAAVLIGLLISVIILTLFWLWLFPNS